MTNPTPISTASSSDDLVVNRDPLPEEILRSWAKSYREAMPQQRFESDPDAEFFPEDMERCADEIERLHQPVAGDVVEREWRWKIIAILRPLIIRDVFDVKKGQAADEILKLIGGGK